MTIPRGRRAFRHLIDLPLVRITEEQNTKAADFTQPSICATLYPALRCDCGKYRLYWEDNP